MLDFTQYSLNFIFLKIYIFVIKFQSNMADAKLADLVARLEVAVQKLEKGGVLQPGQAQQILANGWISNFN